MYGFGGLNMLFLSIQFSLYWQISFSLGLKQKLKEILIFFNNARKADHIYKNKHFSMSGTIS